MAIQIHLSFYFPGHQDHNWHLWSNAWCRFLGRSGSLQAWALPWSRNWEVQKFWPDNSIRPWKAHLHWKYACTEWALSFSGSFSAAFWVFGAQSGLPGTGHWISPRLSRFHHEDSRKNLKLLQLLGQLQFWKNDQHKNVWHVLKKIFLNVFKYCSSATPILKQINGYLLVKSTKEFHDFNLTHVFSRNEDAGVD